MSLRSQEFELRRSNSYLYSFINKIIVLTLKFSPTIATPSQTIEKQTKSPRCSCISSCVNKYVCIFLTIISFVIPRYINVNYFEALPMEYHVDLLNGTLDKDL